MKNLLIIGIIISGLFFAHFENVSAEEETSSQPEKQLEIVGFIEESNLENVGAQVGDIIITYNGKLVYSLKNLGALKEAVQTSEVDVVLQRGDEKIKVTIPKGQLGVYLKENAPDHIVDKDAVIIDGIGRFDWGIGMENSFLAAVYRIDEKFAQNISYNDMVGLSGYGFRVHFFDGWCPSSPDATCGKDVGSELLEKLGYETETYFLLSADTKEEFKEKSRTEEELREIIMKSINNGWPVIAIDLIEVPEWGLITGYQKDGKELFCRTYFDKTKGYEIAEKFPWIIVVIKDKKDVELLPEYKNSLLLAKELYATPKYDYYFSGLKAIEEWIIALKNEESFKEMEEKKIEEVYLANWWTYYSLYDARDIAWQYLKDNHYKFDIDIELIKNLSELYQKEVQMLKDGFQYVPSPHEGKNPADWSNEIRAKQVEILKTLLELEKEAYEQLSKYLGN